jgi:hypothetical protein
VEDVRVGGRRRRVYELTEAGRAELGASREPVTAPIRALVSAQVISSLGSLMTVVALRLVRTADLYRLGGLAWAFQALPLWAIAASRSPLVAGVALGRSGLANGVRVPPIAALTLERVPPPICAETMTVVSSLVLGTGFLALLAAGPALAHADPAFAWAGIATIQSVAALLFARSAILVASERPLPSWPAG